MFRRRRSHATLAHRSDPLTALTHGALACVLPLAFSVACSPTGATVVHPMEVHFAAEQPADGTQTLPNWCEGGVCTVGPRVVLDERAVDRVMLQPGETRAGLVLQLDAKGVARLKVMLQGHSGDQRLSVVVDGKALKAWSAQRSLDSKSIRVTGPRKDMMRLYQTLTRRPAAKRARRRVRAPAAQPDAQ